MDPSWPQRNTLAGRELPKDLVSNVNMGQLFYILSHIQKLSAQAPVTAQRILAENPQICHALLHAECLAGMLDEPVLPLSAEELRRTKAKAQQMQETTLGDSMTRGVQSKGTGRIRLSPVPPLGQDQKAQLMQKLMQLTPEQISRLPQNTKMQLLSFLEQNKR
eukprot:g13271.t1